MTETTPETTNTEVKITTKFVTSGKRPVIQVRSSDGRKGQYPSELHTTKSHGEAARKFATKIAGKGATVTKIEDGQMGDRFIVTTNAPATVPLTTESSR